MLRLYRALGGANARHAQRLALIAKVEPRAALLVGKPVDRIGDTVHLDLYSKVAVRRGRRRQFSERVLQPGRGAPQRAAAGARQHLTADRRRRRFRLAVVAVGRVAIRLAAVGHNVRLL